MWGAGASPIGRLVHGGGYILSLGVKHDTTTAYHIAEVALGVGCIDEFGSKDRIVNSEGAVQVVPSLAWRSQRCPVDPSKIGDLLDERRQQTHGKVGAAAATLAKAIDIFHAREDQLRGVNAQRV